jgi:DNA-binding NarL/FixJ family response regulator
VGSSDPLARIGIAQALREARIDVVAAAGDGPDLLRKARAHHPDLAVVDLDPEPSPDDGDGTEIVRGIRSIDPPVPVLILSRHSDERYVLEVVGDEPQGFGFLVKARIAEVEHFTATARRVACGGTAIDPVVISRLAGVHSEDRLEGLTARERQVLALMAEGQANPCIARKLVVTIPAVERHITSIYVKLGFRPNRDDHRRTLAILRYLGVSRPLGVARADSCDGTVPALQRRPRRRSADAWQSAAREPHIRSWG